MQEPFANQEIYPASIDKSGRILLPVELRRPMNINHESDLSWVKDESGLRLRTYKETIVEIQSYFMSLSPAEDVWSEELIAERKREAAIEHAEYERQAGEAENE